jgi:hypothetical protein
MTGLVTVLLGLTIYAAQKSVVPAVSAVAAAMERPDLVVVGWIPGRLETADLVTKALDTASISSATGGSKSYYVAVPPPRVEEAAAILIADSQKHGYEFWKR